MSEQTEENFDPKEVMIPFTDEQLSTGSASYGGARSRAPIGDYTCEVIGVKKQATKKQDHVMLVVQSKLVKALGKDDAGVGAVLTNYYAGSKESPEFMQGRLKAFYRAIGAKAGPQGVTRAAIIGKRFDGTIVWELSDAKPNPETGAPGKRFINDRLIGERAVGAGRPAGVDDPKVMSREAIAYAGQTGEDADDAGAPATQAPPWEKNGNGHVAGAAAGAAAPQPKQFVEPAEDEKAQVMQYRAYHQLGTPEGPEAKTALLESGIDPDGAVDPDVLETIDSVLAANWRKEKGIKKGGLKGIGKRAKA